MVEELLYLQICGFGLQLFAFWGFDFYADHIFFDIMII